MLVWIRADVMQLIPPSHEGVEANAHLPRPHSQEMATISCPDIPGLDMLPCMMVLPCDLPPPPWYGYIPLPFQYPSVPSTVTAFRCCVARLWDSPRCRSTGCHLGHDIDTPSGGLPGRFCRSSEDDNVPATVVIFGLRRCPADRKLREK